MQCMKIRYSITVTPNRNVVSKHGSFRQSKNDRVEEKDLKLEVQKSEFVEVPRLQNKASLAMARNGFFMSNMKYKQNPIQE